MNRGWRFCRPYRIVFRSARLRLLVPDVARFSVVFGRSCSEVAPKFVGHSALTRLGVPVALARHGDCCVLFVREGLARRTDAEQPLHRNRPEEGLPVQGERHRGETDPQPVAGVRVWRRTRSCPCPPALRTTLRRAALPGSLAESAASCEGRGRSPVGGHRAGSRCHADDRGAP